MKKGANPYIKLWSYFSRNRKIQFARLSLVALLSSIAEVVSVGAVLPFLTIILNREKDLISTNYKLIEEVSKFVDGERIVIAATVLFCMTALLAALMRIMTLWYMTKVSFNAGSDISCEVYERTLHQPYSLHCARNSSDVINAIAVKSSVLIYNVIFPMLSIINSIIILIFVIITLAYINIEATLLVFLGFGGFYLITGRVFKQQMARDSRLIADESTNIIRILQEGLGGIRDILLGGYQDKYLAIYKQANQRLRAVQARNLFLGGSPRYIVETIGIIALCLLALKATLEKMDVAQLLPLVGCLALASQRMLPLIQQAFGSWVTLKGSRESLIDILALLEQSYYKKQQEVKLIKFDESIRFINVSFRYNEKSRDVIKNANIEIRKGEKVAIVGESGAGKSTLMDLMMGLQQPTAGIITIDGNPLYKDNIIQWRRTVAHVPQNVYVHDSSIRENIAFHSQEEGMSEQRVQLAAEMAQLKEFIESLPNKYSTNVGERGSLLSGGQRQRIGIARALFKGANVIFLDEATNALDSAIEEQVMAEIVGLGEKYTVIIISHSAAVLKYCDKVIEISSSGEIASNHLRNM